jgi:two-component system invasion response regulator UvrY
MSDKLEVLILDDHAMIRKGIRLTIETTFGIKSISEVSSCNALLNHLKQFPVTHLLLDLLVSDGNTLEIIPVIKKLYPRMRILVFTMQPPEVYAIVLRQYGIQEYLHKEASEESTIAILHNFFLGSPRDGLKPGAEIVNPFSKLTPRELEVLHYVLKGIGTKQIADILGLHISTVSTLKGRIFEKTNTVNIKQLIDIAVVFNISS